MNKFKDRLDNKSKVTFEEVNNCEIPNNAEVKVIESKDAVIVKYSKVKSNNISKYKKCKGNTYINMFTGEVKKYKKKHFKTIEMIRENMRKLRLLIELNFNFRSEDILFITLTCNKLVKSIKTIKKFKENFIRRLKAKYSKKDFLYVGKYERSKNGSWHIHFLIKDTKNKKMYIPNEIIQKLWEKGFTKTKKVKKDSKVVIKGKNSNDDKEYEDLNNDNDCEDLNDDEEGENLNDDEEYDIVDYMCKTNQLYNVPINEQIYCTSKNIDRGQASKMKYEEAQAKTKNYILVKERTIEVKNADQFVNKHNKKIYNK